MARTEQGSRPERRRFITRHHVEDAAASGQSIRVQGRDVITDEAAQRASDLGVPIERDRTTAAVPRAFGVTTSTMAPPTVVSPTVASPTMALSAPRGGSDADLRRAVRAAVVAELGTDPPGLDAAIDRVLKSRSKS